MRPKKIAAYLVLLALAVAGYQVGTFAIHYANVQSALDTQILNYTEVDEREFRRQLCDAMRLMDVELHPGDVEIKADRLKKSVQVSFTYSHELSLLFVSFEKDVRVRSYKKDLDL